MSDNISIIRLADLSRFGKTCLELIHSITSEIIVNLEKTIRSDFNRNNYSVFFEKLGNINKAALEVCEIWNALGGYFTKLIFGDDQLALSGDTCEIVTSQQHQISFLLKFVKRCAKDFSFGEPSSEDFCEFKACLELLKKLLGELLNVEK
jgi:hypothetical protein